MLSISIFSQRSKAFINTVQAAILEELRENRHPCPRRPWIHAADVTEGLVYASNSRKFAEQMKAFLKSPLCFERIDVPICVGTSSTDFQATTEKKHQTL